MPYPQVTLELRGILRHGQFLLLRVHELEGASAAGRRRHTPRDGLTARLTDDAGRLVAQGEVGLLAATTAGAPSALVGVLLPLVAGDRTHRDVTAELLEHDHVVWREPIAPQRPRLDARADHEPAGIVVRWDGEGTPVDIYAVSPDGRSRIPVLRGATGADATISTDALPGGPVRIRVRTVSGLRESYADAGEVRMPDKPGTVHTWLEREVIPRGQPVTAFVTAVDGWGRALQPDHTSWSLDGEPVGTGATMVLLPEPGEHAVTARHPNGGEETVRLTVTGDLKRAGP